MTSPRVVLCGTIVFLSYNLSSALRNSFSLGFSYGIVIDSSSLAAFRQLLAGIATPRKMKNYIPALTFGKRTEHLKKE